MTLFCVNLFQDKTHFSQKSQKSQLLINIPKVKIVELAVLVILATGRRRKVIRII